MHFRNSNYFTSPRIFSKNDEIPVELVYSFFTTMVWPRMEKINKQSLPTGTYEFKDIIQEVCLRYFRSNTMFLGMYNCFVMFGEEGLNGYVALVVYNREKDIYRSEKNHILLNDHDDQSFIKYDKKSCVPYITKKKYENLEEIIDRVLSLVDKRGREVFELRVNQGYQFVEIADELNIPEGTVKSVFYKIRDDIRQLMKVLQYST